MERSSDGHLAAETAERARIAQDYRVGAFKDDQPLASLIARLIGGAERSLAQVLENRVVIEVLAGS
jgi:hypothetical protein